MNDEPGVYRSDVDGHLLILKIGPTSCTCIVCVETCSRDAFKTFMDFQKAAIQFVNKHGALGERIATSIVELIPAAMEKVTFMPMVDA